MSIFRMDRPRDRRRLRAMGNPELNRLVAMRQQCNQAFADLDVQLRRPHDIVFNLVETVNGYASHERSTLDAVIEARNAAIAAQRPPAKAQAALGGAVRQLFAVAEAYPNLRLQQFPKASNRFGRDRRQARRRRRFFNSMVQGYNSMIQRFPTLLFAHAFGFAPHEFSSIGDERPILDQAAPQVRF